MDNEGTVKLIDLENLVVVNKTRVRAVGAPGANVVHTRSGHFAICLLCLSKLIHQINVPSLKEDTILGSMQQLPRLVFGQQSHF